MKREYAGCLVSGGAVFVVFQELNPYLVSMKRLAFVCVLLICGTTIPDLRAQNFTMGLGSGINFSDIHGTGTTGNWKPKPGPSTGMFFRWSPIPQVGLQTGIDFSTVYYEYHPYVSDPGPEYYPMIEPWLYPDFGMIQSVPNSNHSFLTLPLQVTLTIPSRPSLTLGAGMYWTAILDRDFYFIRYGNAESGPRNDYGYIFSAMIDYPVTEKFSLFAGCRYLTGRRRFSDVFDYRHGWSDLVAGLSFGFGGKRGNEPEEEGLEPDVNENLTISWFAGASLSWNTGNIVKDRYSSYAGPSAGFTVDMRLGESSAWFSTGLIMERTGYSMRDSSDVFYRYSKSGPAEYYADTRTSSDYAVIPALFGFRFGRNDILCLSTGPWFAARLNSQCRGMAWNEVTGTDYYRRTEITVSDDITEVTRRNDFGWMAGAGLSLPVGSAAKVNLGVMFRQGIPEVLNHDKASIPAYVPDGEAFIRNRSLSFQAGLTLPVFRSGR